jgi:hypothetical protein
MRLSVCGTIIHCDNAEPCDNELFTGYFATECSAARERFQPTREGYLSKTSEAP